MIEEIMMLDAVEKYIKGEMLPDERVYFEQLRKANSEVDQLVVEHTIFLNQMNKFGDRKNFKTELQDIHNSLFEAGELRTATPQAKVVGFVMKYRRILAAAASIAGITALAISGLVAYLTPKGSKSEIEMLKRELNAVKISQKKTQNEINNINSNTAAVPNINSKPAAPGKFGGTGFLVDGKGYLVTSAHVVKNADSIYVVNTKGEYFKAKTILVNDNTDIAVLKIEDTRFQSYKSIPYSIKKSSADLGESIFTLGFPRSEIVYNEGYLSAKTGYNGDTIAYQVAISANPGNSGGPIFNTSGEIIGILSGKQTTAEGVVFSSKSKNILSALEDIKKDTAAKADIRIPGNSSVRGIDRIQQVKKIEDCIFNVMSY